MQGVLNKCNLDTHWSGAVILFKDGANTTIINRDDASGLRLDTPATKSQHRTLVVNGN